MALIKVLIGLAAIGGLAWFCANSHHEHIEKDLSAKAAEVVAPVPGVVVEELLVDGRDVTLKGVVPSEAVRDKLLADTRAIEGVRVVNDELRIAGGAVPDQPSEVEKPVVEKPVVEKPAEVAKPAEVVPVKPSETPTPASKGANVTVTRAADGKVTLKGVIDDQGTKDAILGSAQALFDKENVIDEMVVGKMDPVPGFGTTVMAALPVLDKVDDGRIFATNGLIEVVGNARRRGATANNKQDVDKAAKDKVNVSWKVTDPKPFDATKLSLEAEKVGTLVILRGLAPDPITKQTWGAAARFNVGEKNVQDKIKIAQGALPQPDFAKAGAEAIRQLIVLKEGKVSGRVGAITILGQAERKGDKRSIARALNKLGAKTKFDLRIKGVGDEDAPKPPAPAVVPGETPPPAVVENKARIEVMKKCQDTVNTLLASEKIRFRSGSSRVVKASYGLLDKIASALKECPAANIRIEGHTDSQGWKDGNKKLSLERATAVERLLIKRGLDARRVSADGIGEERPIAENRTEKGRAKNRRIEFILVDSEAAATDE